MPRDFYVILGISASATPDEVRHAYRQKVLELHPDHHGPDAKPFFEVQKAYAVLGDPGKRRYTMNR